MSVSQVELNLASHQASSACPVGWAGPEACLGSRGLPVLPSASRDPSRWRGGAGQAGESELLLLLAQLRSAFPSCCCLE